MSRSHTLNPRRARRTRVRACPYRHAVIEHRSVRVQAVIARAPAPPGCTAPFPIEVDWWPGTMLAWRWIDRERRTWMALVRYQRDGLTHEQWVNGDLLDVEPVG